jgi:protein-tyrosine phosphatase
MSSANKIRVLFVCMGNICRSPAAEGVFLSLLEEEGLAGQFEVDSAGTGGWHQGKLADPRMSAAAAARGLTLGSRARQIEAGDLQRFDLILTMDDDNLATVRALDPSGRWQHRIQALTNHCQRFNSTEVPDPYYGGEAGFEQVLDLLEDACAGLLSSLRRQRAQQQGQQQ